MPSPKTAIRTASSSSAPPAATPTALNRPLPASAQTAAAGRGGYGVQPAPSSAPPATADQPVAVATQQPSTAATAVEVIVSWNAAVKK